MSAPSLAGAVEEAEPQVFTLGGKRFRVAIPRSVGQHIYFLRHVRKAGIYKLAPPAQPDAPRPRLNLDDILDALLESGRTLHVIAAGLVEVDQPWSESAADANASLFWALTDPDEVATLTDLITDVLLGFTRGSGERAETTPTVSSQEEVPGAAEQPKATTGADSA